ncbi:MAG: DUF6544 family protein [Dehalogenimonas sp.]
MDWIIIFLIADFLLAILIGIFITKRIKSWDSARKQEIKKLLTAAEPLNKTFKPSDADRLPLPVRRYLQKTVKEGAAYISTTQLNQSGQIRFNDRWIKLNAHQYYSVQPTGFIWDAKMKLGPAWITARDRYQNGKGNMLIKILSALTLFDVKSKEMDHASILRHLSELPWLPTALLVDNIIWEEIDAHTAKATIKDGDLRAFGTFYFNEQDEITGFSAPERFRSDSGKMEPWSGSFSNYRQFGDYLIPTEASALWNSPGGDFEYVRINIQEAEFNLKPFD